MQVPPFALGQGSCYSMGIAMPILKGQTVVGRQAGIET